MKLTFLVMGFLALHGSAVALEAAAVRDGTHDELIGVSLQGETIKALITSIANGINTCSGKNMRYSPSDGASDSDGCVDTLVSRCAKASKIYMPNSTSPPPDADGCVAIPSTSPSQKPTYTFRVGACRSINLDNSSKYPRCAANEVQWGADNLGMKTGDKIWYSRIVCCDVIIE